MPRRYSVREVPLALERAGFQFQRQQGSHMQYRGVWRGRQRNVTLVAGQRQIPPRTLDSILDQAGLTVRELSLLIEGEDVAE